ncbi:MAG: NAD(P)-dependent oxidoreductase [Betaproteobacteria bacterium]|nr:NAD(P)-dependent oxidoreductase [Betaproteobacteria bacterium]
MSALPKIGFIGVGLMGKPMTLRLLAAGYKVAVWNRTAAKLAPVTAKGALAKDSPVGVARFADIVLMCVTDQDSVREVLFGAGGVAEAAVDGAGEGKIVVDFSSVAPAAARECAARLEALGMGYVDAPVSGGTVGAEQGTLAIMAGGKAEHIEFVRPLIAELAARFTRMGGPGAGQVTKLCNQVIVASLFPVMAEAIRLAEAAGVDAAQLPVALKGGFADSIPLQVFGPRIAARAWEPALGTSAVMLKDLENALAVADELGLPLPMAQGAAARYRMLEARGGAQSEPSRLVELLGGEAKL